MRWVEHERELPSVVAALQDSTTYFVDTEFESTKRQNTLSVLQVSSGREVFLIDALRIRDLGALSALLMRPDTTWVLHAGLQDVELLLQRFGERAPPRLFDTQVAWAMIGPEAGVSLAYLKYRVLGVRSMKTHQVDDWMRRPLPPEQLAYAAADIEELPPIHAHLCARLSELERLDLVAEICREQLWPAPEAPTNLSLESFRNAWQLEPANQAALVAIITWYNRLDARNRSRCPPPKTLLAIASRLPPSARELRRLKGVPAQFPEHLATELVGELRRAVDAADQREHVEIAPPAYGSFEELSLDAWLGTLRADVCRAVQMAPELAFPTRWLRGVKPVLLETKDAGPLLASLDGWRRRVLGRATTHFVETHPLPTGVH